MKGQIGVFRPASHFPAIRIEFVWYSFKLAFGCSTHLPPAVWQAERAREREREGERDREGERETARERASGGEGMEMEIYSETARERGEGARKRETAWSLGFAREASHAVRTCPLFMENAEECSSTKVDSLGFKLEASGVLRTSLYLIFAY